MLDNLGQGSESETVSHKVVYFIFVSVVTIIAAAILIL